MKKNSFRDFWNKLLNPDAATLKQVDKISKVVSMVSGSGLLLLKALDSASMQRTTYADLLKLFDEDKVTDYRLDMSSRQLTFRRKGQKTFEQVFVPDARLFLNDIHEKVKSYNKDHPDAPVKMDYAHGIPNWVLALLCTGVIGFYVLDAMLLAKSNGVPSMPVVKDDHKQQGYVKSNFSMEAQSNTTFDDVAGLEEEKEELKEVVEYLRDPDKFRKLGARVPKGVLLIGPPGTGKTLLARAVAGEAHVPFFSISGSEFVEMFVGVGAARVRDLFQKAKDNAPAIIFIDEIDAMARRRGSDMFTGNEERETTLNQLLVEMDGFATDSGIILIGATNRSDILDPALLRPGRFDRHVAVGYPDIKGRTEILQVHAKGKPLAEDVDLVTLAKSTSGFTGADLENLLNEAALLAAKRNKTEIGNEELKEASVKVVMGTEKRSKKMSDKERRLTAFHEAGHAVVTYHLPDLDPVEEVSIIPRGSAGGYTMSLPQEDRSYASRDEMLDELVALLGGRVAEAIVFGDVSTGASNDIERATGLARGMITRYGMSSTLGPVAYESDTGRYFAYGQKAYSEKTASAIDEEVNTLMNHAYNRAERLLKDNRPQLDALADYLLENEKIDADGFKELMAAH